MFAPYRPCTVLGCMAKNLLFRIGLGGLLKRALRGLRREETWATLPLAQVRDHVTAIHRRLTSHASMAEADLAGRVALEIGPGTDLGVALLFLMNGCRRVVVVDEARSVSSAGAERLYRRLVAARGADPQAFLGDAHGLSRDRLSYYPSTPFESFDALAQSSVDVIYSHHVLEHTGDLQACFANMFRLLKPGGHCMHVVDLSGHGEFHDPQDPLGFLRYPPHLYDWMYSCRRGVNRARLGAYVEAAERAGLDGVDITVLGRAAPGYVKRIRPLLWRDMARLPAAELAVTSFSLLARKP